LLAWALEGPVLVWLGTRYRLAIVRHAGALVLLLATGRLLQAHRLAHHDSFVRSSTPGSPAPSRWCRRALRLGCRAAARPSTVIRRPLAGAVMILAGVLTLGLVHWLWLARVLTGDHDSAYLTVLAWWLLVSGGAIAVAWRRPVRLAGRAGHRRRRHGDRARRRDVAAGMGLPFSTCASRPGGDRRGVAGPWLGGAS
jgi:hypothetical protein